MTMNTNTNHSPSLPPLPEAANDARQFGRAGYTAAVSPAYTAEQMRAYALAALAQQPQADEVTDAQRDVVAERARQVAVEGWTPEHDDETHGTEDLAFAASCYATADEGDAPPAVWPWHRLWWKPSDRRRNLVKAGALILAEIERLDRAAMQKDNQ